MNFREYVIKIAKKVAVDGVTRSPWWQYCEPEIPEEVKKYYDELQRKQHNYYKE